MTINVFGYQICMKKESVVVLGVILALALGMAGYFISRGNSRIIIEKREDSRAPEKNPAAAHESSIDNKVSNDINDRKSQEISNGIENEIKVYVTGCVKSPGIVTLKKGQLIDDAIKAAGGAAADADMSSINLVYKLTENVTLVINSKTSEKLPAKEIEKNNDAGKGITIIKDSGGTILNEAASKTNTSTKVNINTATIDELDTLPWVGKGLAADIIAYRKKNGQFKNIKDIMKVPGIKESKFSKFKDFITVE